MPLVDLNARCLLRLQGPDAVRYLNGQVTQDVRLLLRQATHALPSCVTDAKGRLQAFVTLYLRDVTGPVLWIEAPLELRDVLFARLSRYLIADDAEIDDISEQYRLEHHLGESSETGDFIYDRFGQVGFDRWCAADSAIGGTEIITAEQAEAIRIQHGIPAWGKELCEGLLPPEAGLDDTAISYQKGCYIGQEVISRIKSAGKVNRRLYRFLLENKTVAAGALLLDVNGAEVGALTSVAHPHALGYVAKKAFGQTRFSLRLPDGAVLPAAASLCDQR